MLSLSVFQEITFQRITAQIDRPFKTETGSDLSSAVPGDRLPSCIPYPGTWCQLRLPTITRGIWHKTALGGPAQRLIGRRLRSGRTHELAIAELLMNGTTGVERSVNQPKKAMCSCVQFRGNLASKWGSCGFVENTSEKSG